MEYVPESFSLPVDFKLEIMGAYKLRARGNLSQKTAPVIAKFLKSSPRGHLLQLSRQSNQLKYHKCKIMIYPDLSLQMLHLRKDFNLTVRWQGTRKLNAFCIQQSFAFFSEMRSKDLQAHLLLGNFIGSVLIRWVTDLHIFFWSLFPFLFISCCY